jgi:hypothetical protein
MSLSDKLALRTFPTRDVTLCLDADLSSQRDTLMAKIDSARKDSRARSGISGLQRQIAELEASMRASLVVIRVTGLPYAEYNKIMRAHPPKKGQLSNFNPETFYSDLVYKSAALVDGDQVQPLVDVARSEWDQLVASLTDGEFDMLAGAALEVNRERGRQIGFLGGTSNETPSSSETSESPEASE